MSRRGICRWTWAILLGTACTLSVPANAQQSRRGAVLGGLAGAAAGAVIGDHNDEAGAGAAIGGALGIVAGSLLGQAEDQRRAEYYHWQHQQAQQAFGQRATGLTTADIVQMTRHRVGDSVIIGAIQTQGVQQSPRVEDLIYLSQNGVSEHVIRALQAAPTAYTSAGNGPPMVSTTGPAIMVHRYPQPPIVHHYAVPRPPVVIHYGHHSGCGPRYRHR